MRTSTLGAISMARRSIEALFVAAHRPGRLRDLLAVLTGALK
jgi:hypothetical protein